MRLLFDNNLSHRLIENLSDLFPESSQVMIEGLDDADDGIIWKFAQENEFVIVTKDSDFHDLSILKGSPPKVIWLRIGNCRILDIERIMRKNIAEIDAFLNDPNIDILTLD